MPRTIELSDSTHSRLVELMGPDDTTESAVLRLLDFYGVQMGNSGGALPQRAAENELRFKGVETPDLTHTSVLMAQIDGLELPRAKWNTILSHLAVTAFKKGAADVTSLVISGIAPGKRTDSGYKFYPEANISIQGQDANDAWRLSLALANRLNADLLVECVWRNKEKAAYPGKKAVLVSR